MPSGPQTPTPPIDSEATIADALARVQEAVTDRKEGELVESVEAAIEAIDAANEPAETEEGARLATLADALEGALDELEKGKVAALLPIIEEAQAAEPSDPARS